MRFTSLVWGAGPRTMGRVARAPPGDRSAQRCRRTCVLCKFVLRAMVCMVRIPCQNLGVGPGRVSSL